MIRPQINFAGGELDPALHGRTDQVKYQTGLAAARNVTIRRGGGVSNRAGTQFVGEVSDSTVTPQLIPFVFSESDEDQNYVMEFGHQYIRFHQDGDQVVLTAATITGISKEPEAIITFSAAHGYSVGDEIYLSAIVGMTELNNRNFKVLAVPTTTTLKFGYMYGPYVDTSAFTTYSSAGTAEKIYSVTSTYDRDDLSGLTGYSQSLDVVYLPHPGYAPRTLTRTTHTSWALASITFEPDIAAPTNLVHNGSNGTTSEWVVTSVKEDTYEESVATNTVGTSTEATEDAPITLTWTADAEAVEYNVYKYRNGLAGWIGTAGETTFIDDGIEADTTDNPPVNRSLFTSTDNYPSTSLFYQDRLVLGRDGSVYTSQVSNYTNFTFSPLLFVDDAVTFAIKAKQTNILKHMVEAGTLILFTNSGVYVAQGDGAGILTPNDVNLKRISENGSNGLRPIVIGSDPIYVSERGTSVLGLGQGDTPNLSTFASHLLRGYTIVDWAFQNTPDSTVWMVRSDGTMLGMTYIREHGIVGWHRHDTDGLVERVTTVPEGTRDAVYIVVKRTINGRTVRYIERLHDRYYGTDIRDAKFMDCSLTYDGRNTNELDKVTLTGGTGDWDTDQDLTLTSDSGIFASTDVGNAIHLEDEDQTAFVRLTIKSYTSANSVTVRGDRDIPEALQSEPSWRWVEAKDVISGLWHLEGEDVSVIADGYVKASPNNPSFTTTVTVENGSITLSEPYGVVHVGLPYVSDVKTLPIDTQNGKLSNQMKLVSRVIVKLDESRGVFVGESFPDDEGTSKLQEIKARSTSDSTDEPPPLISDTRSVDISSTLNLGGQVVLREVDPLPMTILSISPVGMLGG